jgi:phospholipid/cholesterol/gamma-HCH transport system substrate-binding protein
VKDNLRGAIWRLAVFVAVCVVGAVALLAVFAQLRFQKEVTYNAEFTNVTGLEEGNFVRIAGVEVGKVKKITINPKSIAVVTFSTDETVVLTEGTKAVIRWADPIGGRFLGLEEGAGGTKRLNPGGTIPTDRTEPALELDTLLGGFRPLFRALNPEQVNALSGQLIQALQGQGTTIKSFLSEAASVTSTLADRDQLIGQVIGNLNVVLGSLSDQSEQLGKTVDTLSDLVHGLADHKEDISTAIAYTNEAAGSVADLLDQTREPVKNTVAQTDKVSGIVLADHDHIDDLLKTLPDTYQILARQGMSGDYFTFYFCEVVLKLNGKGGQPVYVKLAGQTTGRCQPK